MELSYDIVKTPESEWGSLYLPKKQKDLTKKGLRTILFVSCDCGTLMIRNLALFEAKFPEKLNIVAVVTDDPIDPAAKITLKKRVWSQYTPEERQVIFQRLIDTTMDLGIPCYSGAVKTDFFRTLYRDLDPEALLMFCFGQKLDAAIYDYPTFGSYNFHPSDLPKKQGAGTQPFQNAIKNGLKSSPLVIHGVTDTIDIGPIVGASPYMNICLADGSYPSSIITLLNKLTSIGGWMGVALVEELISLKEHSEKSTVTNIDFEQIMPDDLKVHLSAPVVNDLNETYEVPLHPVLS